MSARLTIDKAPYLLTIFVALTGWTLTEITKDLAAIPVISYNQILCKSPGYRCLMFENISGHVAFKKLEISIFDKSIKCKPAPRTKSLKGVELSQGFLPKCEESRSVLQKLESMQPDSSILIAYYAPMPKHRFDVAADANGAVKLLKKGFWTFLINYKRGILIFLLLAWVVGVTWIWCKVNHCENMEPKDEH